MALDVMQASVVPAAAPENNAARGGAGTAKLGRPLTARGRPYGTIARNWLPAPRFPYGRYSSTLRAVDTSGASGGAVSRGLVHA
jgi:hypothetical protein